MEIKYSELTIDELKSIINTAQAEITKRSTSFVCNIYDLVKNTVVPQTTTHWSRYNGGWLKTITGIDKTQENGYSLKGEFIKNVTQLKPNTLVLDCSIGGSRKNQDKYYNLIKVIDADHAEFITSSEGKSWAIELWKAIEENL